MISIKTIGANLLALFFALSFAFAQDFSIPTSWRNSSISRDYDERLSIARNAFDIMMLAIYHLNMEFDGIGLWQSGNVFGSMANFDYIADSNVYEDIVDEGLRTSFNIYRYDVWSVSTCLLPVFFRADEVTCIHASTTTTSSGGLQALTTPTEHTNINHLLYAIAVWLHVSDYIVAPENVRTGIHLKKEFTLAPTCDGVTMVGGVFWTVDALQMEINSVTTSLYMTLSAFLAEATGDQQYIDAAVLSAQWILNQNINSDDILLDTVNGHDCQRGQPGDTVLTYNSGKYLEGLSVLADVTGNGFWRDVMVNITVATMKGAPWHGSDGIITEGGDPEENTDAVGFKAILIRGLDEVYTRSATNKPLQRLISRYVDVQYNALLDLAGNDNVYSASWTGPPQNFTTWGQLAALDVMVASLNAEGEDRRRIYGDHDQYTWLRRLRRNLGSIWKQEDR
ncbi:hypothetical protein D9758_009191 [Tetrapyrgos nigripes]|uniref:Uncharacterized protein n=1 Tax=Tetrapyrgos nigripes TaxID=182062 RepID=A0A8H5D234_9AGAR|nr:hypothetical protein D9758_009191 [Tetrapyrgos nigripes]